MPDPSLEEESLISQDDIDKLLDASSIEEAEEQIDADPSPDENDLDDLGELSQGDIDSLLNGSALNGDDPADNDIEDDILDGELSQDDIDRLMNGPAGADDSDGADEEDDEDLELISQDDIDRLMNPAGEDEDQDSEDFEDDDELISMDDIQGLMDQDDDPLEVEPVEIEPEPTAEEPEAPVLDEDLSLEDEPVSEDVQEETLEADGEEDPLDDVIDVSDAMDVADCLMTQDTMDELLEGAALDLEADSVPDDAEDESEMLDDPTIEGLTADDLPEDEPSDSVILDDEETSELDSLTDDLDQMLESDDSDLVDLDLDGDADGDVTQEDIDALLQESDDDDDILDEDDILISQDDIDTLLMAADQEDEDVLGDSLLDDFDDGDLDDFDTDDFLEGEEDFGVEEDKEQVVLEESDSSQTDDEEEEAPSQVREKIGKILKSKLVLAAASVVLVLMISVPSVYFIFFSEKPAPLPGPESVPLVAQESGRQIEVASVTIDEQPDLMTTRQSGNIVLADFVILASHLSKEMTYVYADISIDYSDQRAYHEISNNLSFYRDLIYEAIQTNLVSERQNEVTQTDLLWGVENSLKKVLPPHYIEKISFKTFRTS